MRKAAYALAILLLAASCDLLDFGTDPVQKQKGEEHPAPDGYVDLGLSVYWSQFNLGCSQPEQYGNYYAWGETDTKDKYTWKYYSLCNGLDSNSAMTKYNAEDGLTELLPQDDVAQAKGDGRLPTIGEWSDLLRYCDWEWQKNYNGTGVAGYLVTSSIEGFQNSSIFLPCAGIRQNETLFRENKIGYYWSSTLDPSSDNSARFMKFETFEMKLDSYGRCYGFSIRPVRDI